MTENDEGHPPGAPAHNRLTGSNHTLPGRQRPALVIRLPLEEYGRICWEAETHEDERRLVYWLQRSDTIPMLTSWIEGLADWLEDEAA
jgi:hypothetical protein